MFNKLKSLFSGDPKLTTPAPEVEESESSQDDEERVYSRDEKDTNSWLGIGLDGVLSVRNGDSSGPIGAPIADMVARVKDWVKYKHLRVKVLTPRAATEEGMHEVHAWLKANRLDFLEVTHQKDLHMVEFWDDRVVQVMANVGISVGGSPAGLDDPPAPDDVAEKNK